MSDEAVSSLIRIALILGGAFLVCNDHGFVGALLIFAGLDML